MVKRKNTIDDAELLRRSVRLSQRRADAAFNNLAAMASPERENDIPLGQKSPENDNSIDDTQNTDIFVAGDPTTGNDDDNTHPPTQVVAVNHGSPTSQTPQTQTNSTHNSDKSEEVHPTAPTQLNTQPNPTAPTQMDTQPNPPPAAPTQMDAQPSGKTTNTSASSTKSKSARANKKKPKKRKPK